MINMDARTFLPETSPTSPSVITLMEKAADCLEIARTQHEAADQQHLDADKLDEIGYALEESAVEMEGKTVLGVVSPVAVLRSDPRQRTRGR
jgi:hypothetical protein